MSHDNTSRRKRKLETAFGQDDGDKSRSSRIKRRGASNSKNGPAPKKNSDGTLKKPNAALGDGHNKLQKIPDQPSVPEAKPGQESSIAHTDKKNKNVFVARRGRQVSQMSKTPRSPEFQWLLSHPEGGRFKTLDAIFVDNNQYLVVAVRTQILLYSVTTSTLIRSFRTRKHSEITSYSVSSSDENTILVTTHSGTLFKWNWTSGKLEQRWDLSRDLLFATEVANVSPGSEGLTMFLLAQDAELRRKLVLTTLGTTSECSPQEQVILEGKSFSPAIKMLDKGKFLVVFAGNVLSLGQKVGGVEAKFEHRWREVKLPQKVVCVDARDRVASTSKRKRSAIDVVVGCSDGSILIYEDIFFKLFHHHQGPQQPGISGRQLVWHREEVLSVKWSIDGNYVISGGHETVMVIWQLDTGERQYLPHLSAAIENISVASTGSAYVLHLSDNSIIVLSASELQPTAYFVGLGIQRPVKGARHHKEIRAIIHPKDPSTIALAVPLDPSRSTLGSSSTLLQTFDFQNHQQKGRQALTRNNITALGVDPTGNPVEEPDVTHMKISCDGGWLATVDEWEPPVQQLNVLSPFSNGADISQRQIFLKFWAHKEAASTWELVTRIQRPNSHKNSTNIRVLDLAANPRRPDFSTISSDFSVHIWALKVGSRSNLPVKDHANAPHYTWICTHTIDLQKNSSLQHLNSTTAMGSLCYSPDGSVLGCSNNETPLVTFLDSYSGSIVQNQRGSQPGRFSCTSFLKHYLITVSEDLRVYNAVSGELLYALALHKGVSGVLLAANTIDETFAVALRIASFAAEARSRVMVFNLKSATPTYDRLHGDAIEILLSLRGESGYLTVNQNAEIAALKTNESGVEKSQYSTNIPSLAQDAMRTGLENLFGRRTLTGASEGPSMGREESAAVPTPQSSLAAIFQQSADLPVSDLFHRVARALGGPISSSNE